MMQQQPDATAVPKTTDEEVLMDLTGLEKVEGLKRGSGETFENKTFEKEFRGPLGGGVPCECVGFAKLSHEIMKT